MKPNTDSSRKQHAFSRACTYQVLLGVCLCAFLLLPVAHGASLNWGVCPDVTFPDAIDCLQQRIALANNYATRPGAALGDESVAHIISLNAGVYVVDTPLSNGPGGPALFPRILSDITIKGVKTPGISSLQGYPINSTGRRSVRLSFFPSQSHGRASS